MKTYLELEGKFGPRPRPQSQTKSQPPTSTPSQNNNSITRKTPGPKMAEKKRRTRVPAKRRYKVRVIVQPLPTTPIMSSSMDPIPTHTVATSTASTQTHLSQWLYTIWHRENLKEFPTPQESPKMRKILPPLTTIHHSLKLHPMPQPSKSEKIPLGLIPCQPL